MAERPGVAGNDDRWRSAGDRISTLLDATASGGVVARERAEQLVREVVDLYGEGLERILARLDDASVGRLTRDDLVASLLLVHGLHPHDVRRRVSDALESVRPYLGSHGGDVDLVDVTGDVVRLRFAGSCGSCPSSSVTLEYAVEDAVRAAAPEISTIEVVPAEAAGPVIAAASLFSHVHANGSGWHQVPELADLGPGEVGGFAVAGVTVLACRVADEVYAYRDRCATCGESMAGAALHRRAGHPIGDAVLRCPRCRSHFDAVHAGAGLDDDSHLEPLPVLVRDGVLSIAVPAGVG